MSSGKKRLKNFLIIMGLMLIFCVGYFVTRCYSYQKINEETRGIVTLSVKESVGEMPDLQTSYCQAEWVTEALSVQKEMMN